MDVMILLSTAEAVDLTPTQKHKGPDRPISVSEAPARNHLRRAVTHTV